jgi:hypothetical protein
MTLQWQAGKVPSMPGVHSIVVSCEIGPDDGSLRGEAQNEFGESRAFAGWTEFASVLMLLASDHRAPDPTNQPEGPHHEQIS